MSPKTAAHLILEAKPRTGSLSPAAAAVAVADQGALLVDRREAEERGREGALRGDLNAPGGGLEFHADPTSALFLDDFDPARSLILVCAAGGRTALAGAILQDPLGYTRASCLDGGFAAWRRAGLDVDVGTSREPPTGDRPESPAD